MNSYVNEVPDVVTSTVKLFADDTKIYRELNHANDTGISTTIGLGFPGKLDNKLARQINSEKCEVMR